MLSLSRPNSTASFWWGSSFCQSLFFTGDVDGSFADSAFSQDGFDELDRFFRFDAPDEREALPLRAYALCRSVLDFADCAIRFLYFDSEE